jgi:hypothetical protein
MMLMTSIRAIAAQRPGPDARVAACATPAEGSLLLLLLP